MPDNSLFDFEAGHLADADFVVLAGFCAVVRRHRHTLRRLKMPMLPFNDASAFADALANCTAITSLDLSSGNSWARRCTR
jgi:hypothetical protein